MATDLAELAREVFIDGDFQTAVDLFTQAITANPNGADLFAERAQANFKLNFFTEAVADANKAIELDPAMTKAYLRKGFACLKLKEYETAKAALEKVASLGKNDSRFTKLISECNERIAEETSDAKLLKPEALPTAAHAPAGPSSTEKVIDSVIQPKYRHSHYQKPEEVVVTIFAKRIPAQNVSVDFGEQILSVTINVPGEEKYQFQPRLFGKIVPDKCRFEVLLTKVEITLAKSEPINWPSLEYSRMEVVPQKLNASVGIGSQRPTYPSSKPRKKDWYKYEAQVKKEEKKEKLDGDAAVNKMFGEIYRSADEDVRRAMMKSFVLSTTNWKEVGSKKVESSPHEQSEYLLEEDSPQSSQVHKHSKHPLKDRHLQLEDPGFEVSPQWSKVHERSKQLWVGEHGNLQDINFHNTESSYNRPGEGNSTKFSGFHGKDDSIPSFFLEAGEKERVMEQELDLIESRSSKVYDDHTLDLSYKSIISLPEDISKYIAVRELKLKGCQLLMELGPEIGELLTLELLDLEGTEIIRLPKEIAKLVNLRSLKFSLYGYADRFQKTKQISPIIPKKALSNLLQLNELSIDVTPDGDWWNDEIKTVIDELHCLQVLKTLCLYIPTVDLFRYLIQQTELFIYEASVRFRFTVGHHDEERLTSRLPQEVLKEFHDFEKFKKGLKFTNGEGVPIEIKNALEHVDAFLLERNWSIKNLLEFGLENTDKLKCCILVECNELQTLIDTKQCMDYDGTILGSLQHLSIHYMKSMQKIWRGPVAEGSLSNLKSLALHTCVRLTTVFKLDMLANLNNLEELRIEDCPEIKTIVSSSFSDVSLSQDFLPKLKSMLLLELPNLRCISSGPAIAPKLERLVIFYCLKLRKLSKTEISNKDLKVLKGEKGWWDALRWYESDVSEADQNDLTNKFVPLKEDGDLEEQFLRD